MRVLFTVHPASGHLQPLIPLARALERDGHEVAVFSAASFRPHVEGFGLTHIGGGLDWLMGDPSTWSPFPPMPEPGPDFPPWVVLTLADITTRRAVGDLLEIAGDWRPDLIVREGMELGGCIAAERLGIPHASVAGNAYAAIDSPRIDYFPGNRLLLAEALARHRAEYELPPDPDVEMPFRHLHLAFTPPAWDGDRVERPANIRFLRHESAVAPDASLPAAVADTNGRPLVLAGLGTVFNKTPGVLESIVEAISEQPVEAIVATGRDVGPERFGSPPANVRLEPYVPQPLLLSRCDAFITHGGFNSVKEALVEGVPMVVVPISADQPYSAARCEELGVGRAVGAEDRTPAAIACALEAVLGETGYRERARAFQAEIEALPGIDEGVRMLERLAAVSDA